jgi:hypothetical protein
MNTICGFCLLSLSLLPSFGAGFIPHRSVRRNTPSFIVLASTTSDNIASNSTGATIGGGEANSQTGYRFGDVTRSLIKKATTRVTELTGKDTYEFGDLSRWLDDKAKSDCNKVTGQKEAYAFGDLTRWVDQQAKSVAANFTGENEYFVGDISREVVRRVVSGEYELRDIWLALRLLVSTGVTLNPIASALPLRVLMELVNLGLMQDVGGRVMEVLGKNLDERFKLALTGDSQYRLGDKSKKELRAALSSFIGKDEYVFGDISQRIATLATAKQDASHGLLVGRTVAEELSDWDRKYQEERNI